MQDYDVSSLYMSFIYLVVFMIHFEASLAVMMGVYLNHLHHESFEIVEKVDWFQV